MDSRRPENRHARRVSPAFFAVLWRQESASILLLCVASYLCLKISSVEHMLCLGVRGSHVLTRVAFLRFLLWTWY